jgi:hypothetical protein
MSYNGWANHSTWAVALWIDNEPGTYETRRDMAREVIRDHENEDGDLDPEQKDDAVSEFADRIQAFVENDMMPDLGASLASDLLSSALSDVDWREIAENWLEED